MRVALKATIPTVTYGNLMPEFEVEADSIEAGLAIIEPRMREIWNKYVENGKELFGSQGVLVEGFCGGSIFYDDRTHTYTNDKGEVYESSSQYAAKLNKPFNKEAIAAATAKKYGVSADEVKRMWEMRGEISRGLGTALHSAIELHRSFHKLAGELGNAKNVHESPMIFKAVSELEKLLPIGNEVCEAVVIDHPNKHVGRVDLINILGDKQCEIIDFKTGSLDKNIDQYWRQLSFTKSILEANDWQVTKLRLFHWETEWTIKEK